MRTLTDAPWQKIDHLPATPLFGTDGMRGRYGDWLTRSLAEQVGGWFGVTLQAATHALGGHVILGQDSRCSSPALAAAVAAGLTAVGLDVWEVGLCPTPGVAHLTQATEAVGGVMISASHNAPEDNGIKLFNGDGCKLSAAQQMAIEMGIRQIRRECLPLPRSPGRQSQRPELRADYLQALLQPLNGQRGRPLLGLKVVLDVAWGAAVELAPQAFRRLGAQVICLHDQPRGDRINVNCGATHLIPLQQAVLTHQADLGFAFDGDADRVLAVDHQGQRVDGDHILYLWGQHLQHRGHLPNRLIVATVMSNLAFERAWQQQGGRLIRTAVGDQHVHRVMHHSGAMLGGEQSGHIVCRHYGMTGDGLLTALHLAHQVSRANRPLATLVEQTFRPYPQSLRNIPVMNGQLRQYWQRCQPLHHALEQAKVSLGQQGRVLIRPSGTEPVLRIMVEAADIAKVNFWTEHLATVAERHLAVPA